MRYFIRLLLVGLLFVPMQTLCGQSSKNTLMVDVWGVSHPFYIFLGAGVSYNRTINPRWQLGTGLAVQDAYGISNHLRVRFTTPTYATYSWKTTRHRPITELGVLWRWTLDGDGDFYVERPIPFTSIGYGFEGDKFVFKLPLKLVFVGINEYSLPVMPWMGIHVGYRLGT